MENNNHKHQQQSEDSGNKEESPNSSGNEDIPSTSSDILHDDLCSICFEDVSILDNTTYVLYTCCGKVMHKKCNNQLAGTKSLSYETKFSCPMCRAPNVTDGSKEHIDRLQKWSLRNRSWAQFNLGRMYHRGGGLEKAIRACELYKLAADQGHHIAQYNLGTMYEQGKGVIESDTFAFKYYEMSAAQGYANAQYNVGIYYASGTGVEHSFTKAKEWWTKAAAQGHEEAIANLKVWDVLPNSEDFKYYQLSAIQGDTDAQCKVGTCYANGIGVERSFTKAREWWAKAAEKGLEDAIKCLKTLDEVEGRKTTSFYAEVTDNLTVLCSKCNKPAQTNRTLRKCQCKGAQYCNNTCYEAHWKEHKPEHNRLFKLLPSTGETKEAATEDNKKTTDANKSKTKKQKPNDRCACGSKKKYKKCCGSKKR